MKAVLVKHEALFADHLDLATEPEEDCLRIPLYPGDEPEIKTQQLYKLGPEERKLVDQCLTNNDNRVDLLPQREY